ncbi:hypothetical protein SAM19_02780 [Brevibacillus laterosporus]|nr:hypothetical protein [Brevibacillus laterosporus]
MNTEYLSINRQYSTIYYKVMIPVITKGVNGIFTFITIYMNKT